MNVRETLYNSKVLSAYGYNLSLFRCNVTKESNIKLNGARTSLL